MTTLIKILVWVRQRTFFRVTQRTLVILIPLALIGSFSQVLYRSIFAPDSLIFNITYMNAWLPSWFLDGAWVATGGLTRVVFGTFGVFAAYFAAQYMARLYRKDSQLSGLGAVAALFIVSYRYHNANTEQMRLNWRLLNITSLLLALIIGYLTGQIFHHLGRETKHYRFEHFQTTQMRAFSGLLPMSVTLSLALVAGLLTSWLNSRAVFSGTYRLIQEGVMDMHFWPSLFSLIFVLFLGWGGLLYPVALLQQSSSSPESIANMNYALEHGSSWKVPYPLLGASLFNSYSSTTLALVIVLLLAAKKAEVFNLAQASLFPILFNSNAGIVIGLPMILNPIYLLPFVLIPVINLLFAAAAIAMHLLPASAYAVLTGTPSILISFIATNGHFSALFFALLLLIADCFLFWPFVVLNQKVEAQLPLSEKEGYLDV